MIVQDLAIPAHLGIVVIHEGASRNATPVSSRPECGQLRAALDEARTQIADLQAELHEVRYQLNRNSSNSS